MFTSRVSIFPMRCHDAFINSGYAVPRFNRQIKPQGQAKIFLEDIEFCPSQYIDDYETVSNELKLGLAELILAKNVAVGHLDDYYASPYCPFLQDQIMFAWNNLTFYPYLELYCLTHGFPNLVAAAEKILHENGLRARSPWDIKIGEVLKNDFWGQAPFQQCHFPTPVFSILGNELLPLPGEQGGCLEVFSKGGYFLVDGSSYSELFPIRGIIPTAPIGFCKMIRFMPLPWEQYPLYGLDELHHSGKKQVILTPSLTEAIMNRNNPDATVVSWLGGTHTLEHIDFEPLKGYSILYVLNPKTFSTKQEAVDCFYQVKQIMEAKEISFNFATTKEP